MAGTPILTNIRKQMAALIGGMKQVDGYNFDWQQVNVLDYSLEPNGVQPFPRAEIYCSEENRDTKEGRSSQAYSNIAHFTVKVACELPQQTTNPLFDIDPYLDMAVDDLSMLFGINDSVNGTCDEIVYTGFKKPDISKSGDQMVPKTMDVTFDVQYSKDRHVPTQIASS
jgi:hypothetical protein